ncbi:MAG: sigma-70 family RNA polymerase sigma factor [Planctomycetota bacterium]
MSQAGSVTPNWELERAHHWREARQGDRKAREYLARRAAAVAAAVLRSRQDLAHVRDDLAQEAGLSMLDYLDRHEQPPGELTHFLRWRARGVISAYRKGNRRPAPEPLLQEPPDGEPRDCPSRRLSSGELHRVVAECRSSLKTRYQEILALRYDEQLSISEIAVRMAAQQNTVTVWMSRARKALADALRSRGVGMSDLD